MELTFASAQRVASVLSGLIKNSSLYPPGNPALTRPLAELHTMLSGFLDSQSSLKLGLSDEILFFEDHLFVSAPQQIEDLAHHFSSRKIQVVIFMRGVEQEELFQLTKLLADKRLSTNEIIDQLEETGIKRVLVIAEEEAEERLLHEAGNAYQDALESIREAFVDIESNRVPSSEKLLAVTRQFSGIAAKDPQVVACLAMIKDYDNYTFNHSVNVGVISMALASYMKLERLMIEEAGMGGFLHDIGKTKVSKNIINKPGKLSNLEFDEIKKHPGDGVTIIKGMPELSDRVSEAVLGHHLRYNRSGYPEWAKEMELSSLCEIIAIADCFDACTTLRTYQLPMPPASAIKRIRELSGDYLNPEMVENFAEMMGKYPPGTVVRLDNNEIALVWRSSVGAPEAPKVKVIFDKDGKKVEKPFNRKLENRKGDAPSIVAVIDPVTKGIDVGAYFRQG